MPWRFCLNLCLLRNKLLFDFWYLTDSQLKTVKLMCSGYLLRCEWCLSAGWCYGPACFARQIQAKSQSHCESRGCQGSWTHNRPDNSSTGRWICNGRRWVSERIEQAGQDGRAYQEVCWCMQRGHWGNGCSGRGSVVCYHGKSRLAAGWNTARIQESTEKSSPQEFAPWWWRCLLAHLSSWLTSTRSTFQSRSIRATVRGSAEDISNSLPRADARNSSGHISTLGDFPR